MKTILSAYILLVFIFTSGCADKSEQPMIGGPEQVKEYIQEATNIFLTTHKVYDEKIQTIVSEHLKFEDPKTLPDIDSVYKTFEPLEHRYEDGFIVFIIPRYDHPVIMTYRRNIISLMTDYPLSEVKADILKIQGANK